MPRKTKEQKENEEIKEIAKKATKKVAKKSTSKVEKKATSTKKDTEKSKKEPTKKAEKDVEKTTSKKSSSKTATSKKATTKVKKESDKQPEKKAAKKTVTKKATAKKTTSNKKSTTTKKSATTKKAKKIEVVEYYDLPYRYNQTVVKLLAQTPKTLFIYWDISDSDRENFKKQYGENFFETTKPILIVHNNTLNYSFEVEINDFANSWYLHVNDSNCDYRIELGRKAFSNTEKLKTNDYVYITTSNEIESPNDRILFDKIQNLVYFKDVKTGKVTSKKINSLHFMKNIGKIYNIYDIYKAIYNDENIEEIYDLSNPSSGNTSSSRNPSSGGII